MGHFQVRVLHDQWSRPHHRQQNQATPPLSNGSSPPPSSAQVPDPPSVPGPEDGVRGRRKLSKALLNRINTTERWAGLNDRCIECIENTQNVKYKEYHLHTLQPAVIYNVVLFFGFPFYILQHLSMRSSVAALFFPRSVFIADKSGVRVSSELQIQDGMIQLFVEKAEIRELKLFVENTGQEPVYFTYYTALHWLQHFTLKDSKRVTRNNPLRLEPCECNQTLQKKLVSVLFLCFIWYHASLCIYDLL